MRAFPFLLLLCMNISCEKYNSNEKHITRIIKNETDHTILIVTFANGASLDSIHILPGNQISDQTICSTERHIIYCNLVWTYERDSVSVVFDNDRFITYCGAAFGCVINAKNMMFFDYLGNEQMGYVESVENVFEFSITDEDYVYSIPLQD